MLLGVAAQRLLRKKTGDGNYRGRTAAIEILRADGNYVQGNIRDNALELVKAGVTDMSEVSRVLG